MEACQLMDCLLIILNYSRQLQYLEGRMIGDQIFVLTTAWLACVSSLVQASVSHPGPQQACNIPIRDG